MRAEAVRLAQEVGLWRPERAQERLKHENLREVLV